MKTAELDLLEKSHLSPAQARAILQVVESELTNPGGVLATKADILALADRFATKTDFQSLEQKFATKADFQSLEQKFATKADFQGLEHKFATKADFQGLELKFATKADFQSLEHKFASKADFERLEQRFVSTAERFEAKFHEHDLKFEVLRTEIQKLRAEMISEIKSTVRWNFAFWATQLAVLVGILRLLK